MDEFICGDSAKVLKESFEDNTFDLTVTSPPYDDLREYNQYEFDFPTIAKELFRVTNEGETVLDIAMGSGTTIEAAERTGRNSLSSWVRWFYFMEPLRCPTQRRADAIKLRRSRKPLGRP